MARYMMVRDLLQHFIYLERPSDVDVEEASEFAPKREYSREPVAYGITPFTPDYETVGEFYSAIRAAALKLSDDLGRKLFVDPAGTRQITAAIASLRLIGSIRRECLDHVFVFGEQHLRHVLSCYMEYYNTARTHLSLDKDTPARRPVETVGRIRARPVLGGLHHQYARI
jgi:hypothetical protein